MSPQDRIEALKEKHAALNAFSMKRTPLPNQTHHDLKRQKLRWDEIYQLERH
jgi:hypothetical protein